MWKAKKIKAFVQILMNVGVSFPDDNIFTQEDEDWSKTLDYIFFWYAYNISAYLFLGHKANILYMYMIIKFCNAFFLKHVFPCTFQGEMSFTQWTLKTIDESSQD